MQTSEWLAPHSPPPPPHPRVGRFMPDRLIANASIPVNSNKHGTVSQSDGMARVSWPSSPWNWNLESGIGTGGIFRARCWFEVAQAQGLRHVNPRVECWERQETGKQGAVSESLPPRPKQEADSSVEPDFGWSGSFPTVLSSKQQAASSKQRAASSEQRASRVKRIVTFEDCHHHHHLDNHYLA